MAPFAVTLSDLIEKGGSYAGLAAFFGLAVLAILYFAQAREIRRLRDWAGRAPERAQELEERVIQQAETARKVTAQPIRRPGEPATAAATAAPATAAGAAQDTVISKPPPSVSETTEADEAAEEEDSATEHEVIKPAASTPAAADTPAEKPAEAEPAVAEGEEETPGDREAVPAGVVASAAVSEPPSIPVAPGNGAPPASEPKLPPRATQGPPVRRPAPAAQPLRASAPATRRPAPPPRRPGPPPPIRRDQEPGRRRTGIIAAGALAGITLIVVGLIAILGGGGDDPATTPEPTAAAQTETVEPGGTGGGNGGEDTTAEAGPTRAETAVAVLNGTTVAGLAATIDDKLLEAGYAEAQEPTNWTDSTRSASVVFYSGSEYRSQAIEVAELLEISDRQAIDDDALALAPNANVVVVVGADQTP